MYNRHSQSNGRTTIILALLLLVVSCWGFAYQAKTAKNQLDGLVFASARLRVTDTVADTQFAPPAVANIAAINAMLADLGPAWSMALELRTGRPTLIEGGAIPWIPGPANALSWQSFGTSCNSNSCIPVETVEAMARQFLARYPAVFMLDGYDLVIDPNGSGPVWDSLYFLRFQPYVKGVPIKGASVIFRINNGNLIQVVVDKVGILPADATAVLSPKGAWSVLHSHIGGPGEDTVTEGGVLEFIPVTPKGMDPEVFNGTVGSMLEYALIWRVSFVRKGVQGTWEGLVDARSGELMAFRDANRYGHVHGGIRPSDGIPPEENRPFPFADIGGGLYTDTAGNFSGNNATSTLVGKYAHINDACGAISNTTSTGDMDFMTDNAAGTDCVVPSGNTAGAGNTHSSRTLFYNLTAINLKAQIFNPSNTWLTSTYITANVNGSALCNASSGGGTVNFYKHVAGSCNNLGEIPGVAMHEWAHSYDDQDGSGADTPPLETYADWTAIIQTHNSCTGAGFLIGSDCDGYGDACTSCTGVRDCDYTKHSSNTPWTSSNHTTGTPSPPTTIWGCSSGSYNGPCGWEDHCESGISTQALWDFVYRDLTDTSAGGPMYPNALDITTAWMLEDRLWFAGVQTLTSSYTCSGGVTSGCSGTVLYSVMRALDDDGDGTANGTPHAHAIYHAMQRHLIHCNTWNDASPQNQNQTSCPALTTPTLSAVAGSNQITLNWTTGGGSATRYFIYRNESGCDVAFNRIAIVNAPTLTYTDNGVVNGTTYYYRIQAVTANDSCVSPSSNCVTTVPQPCAASVFLDKTTYSCAGTVNVSVLDSTPGSSPWTAQAWSTSDSTPRTVTLANNPPGSASYTGTFATTTGTGGAGVVHVANGDTLTVRFVDPTYCGTVNVNVDKTAVIDCAGPAISNVAVTGITDSAATITWTTNEAANSRATYGTAVPPETNKDDLAAYVTSHAVTPTGLAGCTKYYFGVTSADVAGNSATDTNGGAYYSFNTYGRAFAFGPADVEAGTTNWTLTGEWRRDTCKAHGGTYAFKAGAATCPGSYASSTTSDLTWTQDIVLGAAGHGYHLRYWEYYQTESGYDYCRPQISTNGGGTWTTLGTQYAGSGTTWAMKDFDLSAYTGSTVRIRFEFFTDSGVVGEGWYLDDIEISKAQACGAELAYLSNTRTDTCSGSGAGGGNGVVEPGENVAMTATIGNTGTSGATGVTATLTTSTPGVTILDGSAAYPNIAAGGSAAGLDGFAYTVGAAVACGTTLNFTLHMVSAEGNWDGAITQLVGVPGGATATYVSTDVPKPIPDLTTVNSTVVVADTAAIVDVNVTITSLTHTYDGDLDIYILHPDGTMVELSTDNGGTGENYTNTVFDDEASTAITAGTAPFTGSFQPEGLLSALDGKTANGTWTLRVIDDAGTDTGTLTGWSVTIATSGTPVCNICTGSTCTAPGAPALVSATGDCDGVNLVWTAGTGTTNAYNVYRSANTSCPVGALAKLNAGPIPAGTLSYSDATAAPGTTYTYVVRGACDADGSGESPDSNCQSAGRGAVPAGAPGAPVVGDFNGCQASGVNITWDPVTGAEGYDLQVDGSKIETGIASPYVYLPGDSISHTYAVRATAACGTSAFSGTAAGTDVNEGPPSVGTLTMRVMGTNMLISWVQIADPKLVDYYEVMRSLTPAGPFDTSVGTAAGGIHGLYLSLAAEPPTAYYKVRAVKGACAGPLD